MDCRDRVLAVFNGQLPDRVPITELSVDSKIIANHYKGKLALGLSLSKIGWLEKFPGWRRMVKGVVTSKVTYIGGIRTVLDLYRKMGLDLMPVPICLYPMHNWSRPEMQKYIFPHINEYVEEFGRRFRFIPTPYGFDAGYYIDGWLNSEERYNEWGPLDPHNPVRMAVFDAAKKYAKDKKGQWTPYIIPAIGGVSEVTWEALGMPFFAKCLRRRRDFLARVMDDRKNWSIEMIKDLSDHGAENVLIYDDYGYKTGPLMSPKDFHELVTPRMKEIVAEAHRRNMKVLLHSCGNLNEIFQEIISFGIDALNPIEPTANMDIFSLKQQHPNLVFVGNVSPQDLQDKTPEYIRAYTKRLMTEVKKDGHFILASGHSLNPAIKLENYLAMREVHSELAKY